MWLFGHIVLEKLYTSGSAIKACSSHTFLADVIATRKDVFLAQEGQSRLPRAQMKDP